jgi:acetoin utilization deacetylase AcuC-like enzyme
MLDLNRKLEKGFKLVDPEISTQKAYEFLAEPRISILIYLDKDKDYFYYLTEREISSSIKKNNQISEIAIKDITTKSLVFHYDKYAIYKTKYLIKFKKKLSSFGITKPEKILVTNNKEAMGLVSDLVFADIPDTEPDDFKSKLDLFIESDSKPQKNIEKFYETVSGLGFEITNEVKVHISNLLESRLSELEKGKALEEPEVPDLDVAEDLTGDSKRKTSKASGKRAGLVVIYNPNHINHRPKGTSPEMPERLIKIMDLLNKREKVFNSHCKLISDYPPATEEDILRVHTKGYIEFIKNYASKGGGFLGDSTYITKTTHELALLAIGGAIKSAELVLDGKAEFGFGLIRPPGHHASKDKYGGYCIYNNAAILARYLQAKKGLKKILILDWDAHAANGTMNIFLDDPSVLLISLHQDPHNYYPKTGFISQLGKSQGLGHTVNVEMPRGAGDEEYMTVFEELVIPLFEKFNPDFVIGCNGFDPHHSDQFTDLQLTGNGYYKFCEIFRKYMKNKMVILMEGGYNPYMGELTLTMINGLLGFPNQFNDTHLALIQKVTSEERIQVVLNKKLKELKYNLKRYHML